MALDSLLLYFNLFKTFFSLQDIRFDTTKTALVEEKNLFKIILYCLRKIALHALHFRCMLDPITRSYYALAFEEQPQLLREIGRPQLSAHLEAFWESGPCCG